jgi:hypothetical protein
MDNWTVAPWTEEFADDAEHKRLHKLKWGVEEFSDGEVEL